MGGLRSGDFSRPAAGAGARLVFPAVMAVFGTVGLFVRATGLPSTEIALLRALIALVVLTAYSALTGRLEALRAQRRQLRRFLLSGAIMAFNWILLFEAYRHTSIALATLAYYMAPTLIVAGSALLFREHLKPWQIALFALSTLGLVLMLGVSGADSGDLYGILLGLASAVLYATVILLNKSAPRADSVLRTLVQFVAAAAVMLPFVLLTGGFQAGSMGMGGWAAMLVLGIFHTGICYCLYFSAVSRLRGQQVAILSYLDPLVAVLLSVLFLGEKVSAPQLLGGAVMVLAALLNEVLSQRRARAGRPQAPDLNG